MPFSNVAHTYGKGKIRMYGDLFENVNYPRLFSVNNPSHRAAAFLTDCYDVILFGQRDVEFA